MLISSSITVSLTSCSGVLQARGICDLAKKVFHVLKTDPENFEMEFAGTKRRSIRKLQNETKELSKPQKDAKPDNPRPDIAANGSLFCLGAPSTLARSSKGSPRFGGNNKDHVLFPGKPRFPGNCIYFNSPVFVSRSVSVFTSWHHFQGMEMLPGLVLLKLVVVLHTQIGNPPLKTSAPNQQSR